MLLRWPTIRFPALPNSRFGQRIGRPPKIPDAPIHTIAGSKSTRLCEQLFFAMQRKIPDVQIRNNDNWCSLWSTGAVIAWIAHNPIWGGLRIWFIGDFDSFQNNSAFSIRPKIKLIAGAWGNCCGSFRISNDVQIPAAVDFLHAVAYPVSLNAKKLAPQPPRFGPTRNQNQGPLRTDSGWTPSRPASAS